jgi:hypothetical protein
MPSQPIDTPQALDAAIGLGAQATNRANFDKGC